MNNILSKVIIFVAGATIGSLATYKIVKSKYDKLIDEEIESVREAYSRTYDENVKDQDSNEGQNNESDNNKEAYEDYSDETVEEYESIVSQYSGDYEDEGEDAGKDDGEEVDYGMDRPYVISPDAFADSEYVTASFWYFEDGILTDEDYNVIEEEDIEELIGKESLEHFGDYPDDPDTVYVRDDSLKVDYEICRDNRCYSEI